LNAQFYQKPFQNPVLKSESPPLICGTKKEIHMPSQDSPELIYS
jgi:hypothetical protein